MPNISAHWNRTCPDCETTFASVQSMGVCPNCLLAFAVNERGELLRRNHRVGEDPRTKFSPLELEQKHISKAVRFLDLGKITSDEFQYDVLLSFVAMPESFWPDCASLIPNAIALPFSEYVREFLVPVDYMPSPTMFMVDTRSEAAIEAKKHELRPKYEALHKFWESRF